MPIGPRRTPARNHLESRSLLTAIAIIPQMVPTMGHTPRKATTSPLDRYVRPCVNPTRSGGPSVSSEHTTLLRHELTPFCLAAQCGRRERRCYCIAQMRSAFRSVVEDTSTPLTGDKSIPLSVWLSQWRAAGWRGHAARAARSPTLLSVGTATDSGQCVPVGRRGQLNP